MRYIMANLTQRHFRFVPGCDVTRYLVPNKVDWALQDHIHKAMVKSDNSRNVTGDEAYAFLNKSDSSKLSDIAPPDTSYLFLDHSEKDMTEFPLEVRSLFYKFPKFSWMHTIGNREIVTSVYKRLFKLSPRLFDLLQEFLQLSYIES